MTSVVVARACGRIDSMDITGDIAAIREPEDTAHGNKCACVDGPELSCPDIGILAHCDAPLINADVGELAIGDSAERRAVDGGESGTLPSFTGVCILD